MRALVAVLFVLVLAAPAVTAQTIGSPLAGKYESSYTVYGRAIDSKGLPVRGGVAYIEIEQEGVIMQPFRAGINCKGDFIAEFNLKHVDPKGRVKVTVIGPAGRDNATASQALDPFYRRNDLALELPVAWDQLCKNEQDVWAVSASMRVRVLNRTETHKVGDIDVYAKPSNIIFKMRYEPPNGNSVCPPHPQDQTPGSCELFQADERGDIRYTFTLGQPYEAGGQITITSVQDDNVTWSIDIDPRTRLGVRYIEATGQGPPAGIYDTPAPGIALILLAVAAMAFSLRRR